MANFNFSATMPEGGATFILGSWICVTNGHEGFHSHLAESSEPEANQYNASDDTMGLADDLSKVQLSDLLEEQTYSDRKDTQSSRTRQPGCPRTSGSGDNNLAPLDLQTPTVF